ncbi:uncharacterized protein BDZ99DRAFT_465993 [Mytilinidion resinicola]|uniref:Uncharacterized protein n=1 Tax=Mytilinidion resinicola TaxID=574789 RepID=A0A6A6YCX5_9PEZI|nr:uncharacterized protein BDZ99DRAFT_465993 [Mytilinidion resinicola]KAF2806418.1 hypothetical protein BDZ99DRAFT_465993 [Mytilinidion resinicola]
MKTTYILLALTSAAITMAAKKGDDLNVKAIRAWVALREVADAPGGDELRTLRQAAEVKDRLFHAHQKISSIFTYHESLNYHKSIVESALEAIADFACDAGMNGDEAIKNEFKTVKRISSLGGLPASIFSLVHCEPKGDGPPCLEGADLTYYCAHQEAGKQCCRYPCDKIFHSFTPLDLPVEHDEI